jgi:hypothetical protein
MFGRQKRIGRDTYVYLVETVREDGRTKQRIIRNLGRIVAHHIRPCPRFVRGSHYTSNNSADLSL